VLAVAVCAQYTAFFDLAHNTGATTRSNEPTDIALLALNMVKIKNDWIIGTTQNARMLSQVLPYEQPVAMASRKTASAALDPFIAIRSPLR
jgi:hypothetical protein